MSRQFTRDYDLEVARGNISGVAPVNKFGRNIEIDNGVNADIWDGGYTLASGGVSLIWVAPTIARIHDIKSTSGDDASGGIGAKTIRVYGLPSWSDVEVSETIIMNGVSNVATANSYVIIHRLEVLTKGASGPNVGTITATAQTDGTITAQIRPIEGQTQMAIYGIPSTQILYLSQIYAGANKAGGVAGLVDFDLDYNPTPDVELIAFITKHTSGLQTTGTSEAPHPFKPYKKFAGPGILKIHAKSDTNNMDISAGFNGYLVDN